MQDAKFQITKTKTERVQSPLHNPTNQMKIFKSDSDTGKTKSISVKQALRDLGETLYDVLLESKCVSCGTTFWHIK